MHGGLNGCKPESISGNAPANHSPERKNSMAHGHAMAAYAAHVPVQIPPNAGSVQMLWDVGPYAPPQRLVCAAQRARHVMRLTPPTGCAVGGVSTSNKLTAVRHLPSALAAALPCATRCATCRFWNLLSTVASCVHTDPVAGWPGWVT